MSVDSARSRVVYARDCSVKILDHDEAQTFVEENHSQGKSRGNQKIISLGLSVGNEVVGVAQFCTPRTARKKREYTTELLRLCFLKDTRVTGGASKLVKNYIKMFSPSDFFTYQDTTGEVTNVYETCGMQFVRQEPKKQYLVSPGKTLSSAERKDKEVFTLESVARLGPDNLLGTDLGEVFHPDGSRKTNIELFTEELGWGLEDTSGDRLYEWVNPDYTFYTYKITAAGSEKYYYGVSHVKKASASVEDCLDDGYFGSGGRTGNNNKFVNWKKKHSDSLQKEVLQTFPRKSSAYAHEKKLVRDLWKEDPNCLNSRGGGVVTGFNLGQSARYSTANCEIHGESTHSGKSCVACLNSSNISVKSCSIHGEVKHVGDKCCKCRSAKSLRQDSCLIHGDTMHRGDSCLSCVNEETKTVGNCPIHGEVTFQGKTCSTCNRERTISVRECEVHGVTKHFGETCCKCVSAKTFTVKTCPKHGETKHSGGSCIACRESIYKSGNCEIHGLVTFKGNSCVPCSNPTVSMKECQVHGVTKHLGEKCYRCRRSVFELKDCPVHGNTKFQGSLCVKCRSQVKIKDKDCQECGLVFTPTNNRQKLCKRDHYRNCQVCEKPYLWNPKKKACSISCGLTLSQLQRTAESSAL